MNLFLSPRIHPKPYSAEFTGSAELSLALVLRSVRGLKEASSWGSRPLPFHFPTPSGNQQNLTFGSRCFKDEHFNFWLKE